MSRLHSQRRGVRPSGKSRESPLWRQDEDARLWDLMHIRKFTSEQTSYYLNTRTSDACKARYKTLLQKNYSPLAPAARAPIRARHHSNMTLNSTAVQEAETLPTPDSQMSSTGGFEEDNNLGDVFWASTFTPGNDAVSEISTEHEPSVQRTAESVRLSSPAGSLMPFFRTAEVNSNQIRSSDAMTGSQTRGRTQSTLLGLSSCPRSISMNYQEADQDVDLQLYKSADVVNDLAVKFTNEPLPTAVGDIEASWWPQFLHHMGRLTR